MATPTEIKLKKHWNGDTHVRNLVFLKHSCQQGSELCTACYLSCTTFLEAGTITPMQHKDTAWERLRNLPRVRVKRWQDWAAAGLWIPCSSFHIPIPCHQIRSIHLETALSFMAGIRPEQFLWSAKALMKHEKKGPSGDKYLPVILRMSRESGMLNSITESSFSFLFSMRSSSCKKSMWPT